MGSRAGGGGQAPAIRLVVLVLVRNGLDDSLATRLEHALDNGEVLAQVLVADSLNHLDRNELVKLTRHLLHLAVVAHQDLDPLLKPRARHPLRRVRKLLLADGHARHPAAAALRGAHGQAAPAAADLEDVVRRLELELVDDEVELVELRLVERVLGRLEVGARVHPRLVEEEPVHVVAQVVVLRNVAPRPLHRVGSRVVRHRLRPGPDPVEQAQPLLRRVDGRHVLRQHVEEVGQVVGLELAGHVALAETDIRVLYDAPKHLEIKHPHTRVARRPRPPRLARGDVGGCAVGALRSVGHDQPDRARGQGGAERAVECSDANVLRPCRVGAGGFRRPRQGHAQLLNHRHGCFDPILVKAIATPCPAEPGPSSTIGRPHFLLRRQ